MHEITVTNLRARQPLRILFLVSAHNGLSQRAWIALTELGHKVYVAVVDSAAAMEAAVAEHDPELIVCPFLKTLIGTFPARGMVEQWLKAGVVEQGRLHRTEEGTPQGGVVSPVLLNVALHGMEQAAGVRYH
ncbi:MAG: hypothetical protein ACXVH1_33690, partial [Solirubrobacteraceae bacterium]